MFIILIFNLLTQFVFAQQGELFYQPEAGKHAAVGSLEKTRTRFKTANGSTTIDTVSVAASYQYGFTENYSLGVLLEHSKTEESDGDSSSGLEDFQFLFSGYQSFETGRLRYGAQLDISPENNKDNNQFSGVNTLMPYLAYEFAVLPTSYLGFSVDHQLLIGKRVSEDSNGDEIKSSGGEITKLQLYYEHFVDTNVLGAMLSHASFSDTKYDAGTSQGLDILALTFYSRWKVAENLSVLPRFSMGKALDDKINNITIDKVYVFDFYLGARYSF